MATPPPPPPPLLPPSPSPTSMHTPPPSSPPSPPPPPSPSPLPPPPPPPTHPSPPLPPPTPPSLSLPSSQPSPPLLPLPPPPSPPLTSPSLTLPPSQPLPPSSLPLPPPPPPPTPLSSHPPLPPPLRRSSLAALFQTDLEGRLPVQQEVEDLPTRSGLHRALLGMLEGLLATATGVVMVAGASQSDALSTLVSGMAGLSVVVFRSILGEYMSVTSQRDMELAQISRERAVRPAAELATRMARLRSPSRAAGVSGLSRLAGGAVALLPIAFIDDYWTRIVTLVVTVTFASLLFTGLAARAGRIGIMKIVLIAIFGGWIVVGFAIFLATLVSGRVG